MMILISNSGHNGYLGLNLDTNVRLLKEITFDKSQKIKGVIIF